MNAYQLIPYIHTLGGMIRVQDGNLRVGCPCPLAENVRDDLRREKARLIPLLDVATVKSRLEKGGSMTWAHEEAGTTQTGEYVRALKLFTDLLAVYEVVDTWAQVEAVS